MVPYRGNVDYEFKWAKIGDLCRDRYQSLCNFLICEAGDICDSGHNLSVILCSEHIVKFFQQLRQRVAEALTGFPESAFLVEGRVVEIIQLDAEAGGDGVEDKVAHGESWVKSFHRAAKSVSDMKSADRVSGKSLA